MNIIQNNVYARVSENKIIDDSFPNELVQHVSLAPEVVTKCNTYIVRDNQVKSSNGNSQKESLKTPRISDNAGVLQAQISMPRSYSDVTTVTHKQKLHTCSHSSQCFHCRYLTCAKVSKSQSRSAYQNRREKSSVKRSKSRKQMDIKYDAGRVMSRLSRNGTECRDTTSVPTITPLPIPKG